MGYDCTLHLVDEKAIREDFIPRLLATEKDDADSGLMKYFRRLLGTVSKVPLHQLVKSLADEMWGPTVDEDDDDEDDHSPESAAALICQLAISFSACSLPHQYERGFALSLWQDQEEDIAVDYPPVFAFSPEPLFEEVVAAYPELRGQFPTWFTGNYSTGVFIPSAKVPEVLAWVEKKVAAFAKGDRRHFKGLLGILRAATDKHLAYWEATDLALPMAGQFPGDPNLMLAGYLGNEAAAPNRRAEAPLTGRFSSLGCVILDHWLISADGNSFETNFWDLSMWPPPLVYTLSEYAPRFAQSRQGHWLLFSEIDPKAKPRIFRPRLFADLRKQPDGIYPVLVEGAELSIRDGGFIGERLLVFRKPSHNAKVGDRLAPPLWLEGNNWKPIPILAEVDARPSALKSMVEEPVVALIQLADGGDVIIWDGNGYELQDNCFQMTFPMEAMNSHIDWTSSPAGSDGFFYLSGRQLFEVHRHGCPIPHTSEWENIMHVCPGPEGSILLRQGKNKDGDAAKLYFPAEGTFIHIEPELFDDKEYPFVYWSEATDRFIVLAGKFLSVPTATVLALPREKISVEKDV